MCFCIQQEQMEPKVLFFQNKKLAERLQHYQITTEELRNRNEQLQLRLSATDTEIFIINRHTKSVSFCRANLCLIDWLSHFDLQISRSIDWFIYSLVDWLIDWLGDTHQFFLFLFIVYVLSKFFVHLF